MKMDTTTGHFFVVGTVGFLFGHALGLPLGPIMAALFVAGYFFGVILPLRRCEKKPPNSPTNQEEIDEL
jgi:hypothetical protein